MSEEEAIEQALRHARERIKESLRDNMQPGDVDRAYRKLVRRHGPVPFKIRDFVLDPEATTINGMLGIESERAAELRALVRGYIENGQYTDFFNCIKHLSNIRELFLVIHFAATYKIKKEIDLDQAPQASGFMGQGGPQMIVLGEHTKTDHGELEKKQRKFEIMMNAGDLQFSTADEAKIFGMMLQISEIGEA